MAKLKYCKNCRNKNEANFHGYFAWLQDNCYICPLKECGETLVDLDFDTQDYLELLDISRDINFLEAMINLKQKDIIEYELKMSQFRTQANQQKQIESAQNQQKNNAVCCPYCNSENIKKISGTERVVSATMFGIFSKKIGKSFKCNNCGGTF